MAFCLATTVSAQYTLQDADVTVVNGIIEACTHTYPTKDIIIPEILDGQTVRGVGYRVFRLKRLTSLQLPSTLEIIDDYAFFDTRIESLELPAALKSIGQHAFSETYTLISLDMSKCTNLETIADFGFWDCEIDSLDLSNCTSLTSIGYKAFNDNKIASLELPPSMEII